MSLNGLWLPRSAEEPKQKVLLCTSCGREYPLTQKPQWERHVVRCAEEHDADAQEIVARHEASAFTNVGDPERFAFIRKWGGLNKPRGAKRETS